MPAEYEAIEEWKKDPKSLIEYEKVRFEYVWRWFDFHARQRQLILNFFLIASAFIFNACVLSITSKRADLSLLFCLFGIVISLIFLGMDYRNQILLSHGRKLLLEIERNVFFRDDFMSLKIEAGHMCQGIFAYEREHDGSKLKHKFLMPAVYLSVMAVFVIVLFWLR